MLLSLSLLTLWSRPFPLRADKKGDLGEDAAPSKEDDIGDAVDLEENGGFGEGQDGEPEKDPEETSL